MPPKSRTDLLQGTLDMLILRTLAVGGSNHGYGIARRIQQVSDDLLQVEEGSLYPALHRLAKKGLLTAQWKQSENNRRARYYSLTAKGRRRLSVDLESWSTLSEAVSRVLATTLTRLAGRGAMAHG